MKIQLVLAPLPELYQGISKYGTFPPLTLLALGSYIKEFYIGDLEIELLDGQILSVEEIRQLLDADIVGISSSIINYNKALSIAKKAKKIGAKIVLGGAHVSSVAENVLKNREFIDSVVIGDGEIPLLNIVQGRASQEIPNLAYRVQNTIKRNKVFPPDLNELPNIDYTLVKMKTYFENFKKAYPELPFKKPGMLYCSKGCLWQDKNKGCSFCRRENAHWRVKSPIKIWNEIKIQIENWGIDYFWEVSDSFTSDKKWLREFMETKPEDVNPNFILYARANELSERTVQLLKEINCYKIFIGFESGNQTILNFANKGVHVITFYKSLELLKKYNIKILPSFMLGLYNESKESINDTIEFAESLVNSYDIDDMGVSITVPIPESPLFALMMSNINLKKKYGKKDSFNITELQKDWVENFCRINLKDILKAEKYISSLAKTNTGFIT